MSNEIYLRSLNKNEEFLKIFEKGTSEKKYVKKTFYEELKQSKEAIESKILNKGLFNDNTKREKNEFQRENDLYKFLRKTEKNQEICLHNSEYFGEINTNVKSIRNLHESEDDHPPSDQDCRIKIFNFLKSNETVPIENFGSFGDADFLQKKQTDLKQVQIIEASCMSPKSQISSGTNIINSFIKISDEDIENKNKKTAKNISAALLSGPVQTEFTPSRVGFFDTEKSSVIHTKKSKDIVREQFNSTTGASSQDSLEKKINYTKVFENLRFLKRNKGNPQTGTDRTDSYQEKYFVDGLDDYMESNTNLDFILKRKSENSDKENNQNISNTAAKNSNIYQQVTADKNLQQISSREYQYQNKADKQLQNDQLKYFDNKQWQEINQEKTFKDFLVKKEYSDMSENSDNNSCDMQTPGKADESNKHQKKVRGRYANYIDGFT